MRKSDLRKNHEYFDSAITRYRQFIDKIINAQRVVSTAQEKRDLAESVILRFSGHLRIGAIMRREVSYDEEEAI